MDDLDMRKLVKNKLESTIKNLSDDKIIELVSDTEKRKKEKDWKNKFDAFLSKVEEDADGFIDDETRNKIKEARNIHNNK